MNDKESPSDLWKRLASEARPDMPAPPHAEPPPAWFVTRVLAERRESLRARATPWFALPDLGRVAAVSALLAAACAVFVLSTGMVEDLTDPLPMEIEETLFE